MDPVYVVQATMTMDKAHSVRTVTSSAWHVEDPQNTNAPVVNLIFQEPYLKVSVDAIKEKKMSMDRPNALIHVLQANIK